MSGRGNTAPRAEALEPPKGAKCPHCEHQPRTRWDAHQVVYTTVYRESGFRVVTARCSRCTGILWWEEALPAE